MKKQNPFEGWMAEGWKAFHDGLPREKNPHQGYPGRMGKQRTWDKGWIKAKLAEEQGKRAL